MHAVGDVFNGNLLQRALRPEMLPHLAGDLTMLFAHTRCDKRRTRRAKAVILKPSGLSGSMPRRKNSSRDRSRCRKVRTKVLVHERIGKYVMACWHGRMGGEDRGASSPPRRHRGSSFLSQPSPESSPEWQRRDVLRSNEARNNPRPEPARCVSRRSQGQSPGEGADSRSPV